MNPFTKDAFRRLANARDAKALDDFISEFISEDLERYRSLWRTEQQNMALALHHLEAGPDEADIAHRMSFYIDASPHLMGRLRRNLEEQSDSYNKGMVACIVNEAFEDHVYYCLSPDLKNLGLSVSDRIGEIWLQFAEVARAVALAGPGEHPEKICQQCGAKFVPRRKGSAKKPTLFCSAKCRAAHWQSHK